MGKKIDVMQESFVSSVEEVKGELAAEVAIEGSEDEISSLDGPDPWDDPEGSEDTQQKEQAPTSYVTRDPDKISEEFQRSLPVPVPDEELAEHAKEMARIHSLWCKTKLDAKAYAKGCKNITDKAEDDMVTIAAIIEEGTEDRLVICRWEFDYQAGVKRLRRMDTWQIEEEVTLSGDELHLSFDFQKSEDNVAKFFEGNGERLRPVDAFSETGEVVDASLDRQPPCDICPTSDEDCPGRDLCDEACAVDGPTICINKDCASYNEEEANGCLKLEHVWECNECTAPEPEENAAPSPDIDKTTSAHVCKVCGFDTDNHVYLVRHLRDVHALKLSEYKKQFPA